MKTDIFAQCIAAAATCVAAERDALCQLDTFIGDGDHGITAERGFRAAATAAENFEGPADKLFSSIGMAMGRSMGGAIGPLYAAFWSGAGAQCAEVMEIDAAFLAECLAAGLAKLMRIGKTAEGEKTMIDAMSPAVRAMQSVAADAGGLGAMLQAGAEAAKEGSQATREMVARKGRARFLGEKSAGYIDPGSASFALFIDALAAEVQSRERTGKP